MKKSTIFAIGLACFIGVLAAMQADRWIVHKADEPHFVLGTTPTAIPMSYEGSAGPVDFRPAAK
jgi:hypothetical protein